VKLVSSDILRDLDSVSAFAPGGGGTPTPGWQVSATGTGSAQGITLPETIAASDLAVYVNGLRNLTSSYSVLGTTLTITAPAGASIYAEKPRVSGAGGGSIAFPVQKQQLPDNHYAHLLFDMSSDLPVQYNRQIAEWRNEDLQTYTAMMFNAEMKDLFKLVDIGTRTALSQAAN
jgi:hypothetical protein